MPRSSRTLVRALLAGAALLALPLASLQAQAHSQHAGHPAGHAPALGVDTTAFDRAVRPQDDFFAFVNGGWIARTEIPSDRSSYGSFHALADASELAVRELIEAAAAARAPAGSEARKIGDLYASYMDTARIEALGAAPLRPYLDRIATLERHSELPGLLADLVKVGVGGPFSLGVTIDQKRSTEYALAFNQSGLGLPDRDFYLSDQGPLPQLRQAYQSYVQTLLGLTGHAGPVDAAERILELETRIATHHWDRTRNRDANATYNKLAFGELTARAPSFDWSAYAASVGMPAPDSVIVRQPSYLEAVDAIIAETPVETWRDYLSFRVASSFASVLSSDFVDASFELSRLLSGQQEQRPRWKRAVGAVEGAMGEAVGRLYVERHFQADAKARMDALVANLLDAFRAGIDELEWMTPATRAQAHEKLAKFTVKIGYPEEWRDYSTLEVAADDLFGNVLRARAFAFEDALARLGTPVDKAEWFMTPQTVNAYYNPTANEIVFPAAILQPPFFDVAADDAVNYGAIGAVIGHEISHGFDDQGRKYDGAGILRDWWSAEDAAAFEARAEALVAQFGAYEVLPELNVNGKLTLGENIGDLSGLAVAYQAYRRSLNGREAPVIGGFTGDQRFFLGWAQVWRSKAREEALRQQVMTDTHSPARFRGNGPLTNFEPFYAAFGVEEGDGMWRPEAERVKIW